MCIDLKQPKTLDFCLRIRAYVPLTVAAIISLLLHLCGFLIMPDRIFEHKDRSKLVQQQSLELTLTHQQDQSPQLNYLEVNPDVPENKPDRADAYSFKDQQAAGESGIDSDSSMPQLAGDRESKKLIQHDGPTQEIRQQPAITNLTKLDQETEIPESKAAQLMPLTSELPALPNILDEPEISSSEAGITNKLPNDQRDPMNDSLDSMTYDLYMPDPGSTVAKNQDSEMQAEDSINRPQPSVRPRLSPEVLVGQQMQTSGGRVRRGTLAIDASFSEFGEYEQQFYSALQAGWYQEIDFFQPIDRASQVVIQFVLQADGMIRDIEVISSNASRIASLLCQNALSKRSPFRVWTREMIETYGEERQMRVSFRYR